MVRHYAGGKLVSKAARMAIWNGFGEKFIRLSDKGNALIYLNEMIREVDGTLDGSDPVLIKVLEEIGLPIERTYIVQYGPVDPLGRVVGAVYGYW